jgi:hypothetical protein
LGCHQSTIRRLNVALLSYRQRVVGSKCEQTILKGNEEVFIRKVGEVTGLVRGLDKLLFSDQQFFGCFGNYEMRANDADEARQLHVHIAGREAGS